MEIIEEIAEIRRKLQDDMLSPAEREALEERLEGLLRVGPQEMKGVNDGA